MRRGGAVAGRTVVDQGGVAMKSKRSKACDISQRVKARVFERDEGRCIICGATGWGVFPNSHVVKRSHGGLGIEENITTMCVRCHDLFDGTARRSMVPHVECYMKRKYVGWDKSKLIYKKGEDYGKDDAM